MSATDPQADPQTHLDTDPANQPDTSADTATESEGGDTPSGPATDT